MRRGHIRGFVRGKDRKESLSRQKRMDQLKDRFQVHGGEREKTMTSDDEDTYGPKISGADIKTGKQKIIVADSISESSHVGDLGAACLSLQPPMAIVQSHGPNKVCNSSRYIEAF